MAALNKVASYFADEIRDGMRRVRAGMECKQRFSPTVVRLPLPAV